MTAKHTMIQREMAFINTPGSRTGLVNNEGNKEGGCWEGQCEQTMVGAAGKSCRTAAIDPLLQLVVIQGTFIGEVAKETCPLSSPRRCPGSW